MCNPRPVSFAGEDVKFVKQYNYLDIILDDNMTLQPMLKHVKKKINNQVFLFRKIRKYITDKAAISIYKQTILPIIDYTGFLVLACCNSDRSDLQKVQNDILQICYRSKLVDKVSILDLHKKAKLMSLEQHNVKTVVVVHV